MMLGGKTLSLREMEHLQAALDEAIDSLELLTSLPFDPAPYEVQLEVWKDLREKVSVEVLWHPDSKVEVHD
jgi:hypothetical protein